MEAPGIEPGSENRSTTATTCVVRRCMSPRAGWRTTHSRMSLLDFADPPEAVEPAIPDFRYLKSRPGRASSQALAGLTEVRRQGRSCCSQLDFCGVFYQDPHDLGTQRRLHLPRRSQSPPSVSYTHLRAHETPEHLVCRLLLEKK